MKLARLKCECSELDNVLNDAEGIIKKSVLGSKHALFGASCLLMASAYEKRVMVDQALELYAETLKPPQFNYNNDEFQDAMVELKRVQ